MHVESTPAFTDLSDHARRLQATSLHELFVRDPERVRALTVEWNDWRVDFAKERIDAETLGALLKAAEEANLAHWIAALFAGEKVNLSERRPALHPALRAHSSASIVVDGVDVTAEMRATRERMSEITRAVREGRRKGATGRPLRSVINIGIGGSDLGPRLACDALAAHDDARSGAPDVAFVSNVDPEHLTRALAGRDPASTLFIVTSKTFTTQETLANAPQRDASGSRDISARSATSRRISSPSRRTSTPRERSAYATPTSCRWPKVSEAAIRCGQPSGSPIALRAGWQAFADLLDGAQAMDTHFRMAPLERNVPVLLGARRRTGTHAGSDIRNGSSCRMRRRLRGFRLTCSNCSSKATARACCATARRSAAIRRRRYGATSAPTASTRSSSGCTRGRTKRPVEFIVPVRAAASAARPADAARRQRARAGAGAAASAAAKRRCARS